MEGRAGYILDRGCVVAQPDITPFSSYFPEGDPKTSYKKRAIEPAPKRKHTTTCHQNHFGSLARYTQPLKRTHALPVYTQNTTAERKLPPIIKKVYGGPRNEKASGIVFPESITESF